MDFIYSIINGISEVSPDGWASFIGSVLSFLGVFITIRYTKKQFKDEMKMSQEQFKDDKRISVKPYLDIKLKWTSKGLSSFGIFQIGEFKNLNLHKDSNIGLEFTNLGQGNCLECRLVKVIIDGKNVNDEYGDIGNLRVDEKISREITFITWYENTLEEIKSEYIDKKLDDCPSEFKQFRFKHLLKEVEMQFEYKDVLENKYRKNIVLEIFIEFAILAEKPRWEIKDIKFYDVYFKINGNLTTENLIK